MPAPMKSLRPKARPKRRLGPDDEGSTKHPSGKNIYETGEKSAKKFMDGGMVEKGYMDGGEVRRGDVRDNPKLGKCY